MNGGRGGLGFNLMITEDGRPILVPPITDGKGCPVCGAIGNGGHGGNCPNQGKTFNEQGEEIDG